MADSCGKISALIVGVGLFVFSSYWAGNAYAQGIAAQKAELSGYATQPVQNRPDVRQVYPLEIRGAGVAVGEWHQTDL